MAKRTMSVAVLLTLVMVAGAPDTATARAAVKAKSILGTWMAEITIPPNPLSGLQGEVLVELITFTKNGGLVATANNPVFPVPVGGKVKKALLSVSHSSWRTRGSLVQGTNWRFINNKNNGDFLGFMKNRVELELVAPGMLQGRGSVELLNPDLTFMELNGVQAILPTQVRAYRVPVETLD